MRTAGPARVRLLDTATRLFYAEGVHAVGVDRIIVEAGVAKATFYHHFPTKDELVRAYLREQSETQRAKAVQLTQASPRDAVLAIFDSIGEVGRDPTYRGCPFVNAAAEFPDPAHPVRQAVAEHRQWFRDMLRDLLVAADYSDVDRTVDILVALKDGLLVGSDLDNPAAQSAVRDAVARILQAGRHDPSIGGRRVDQVRDRAGRGRSTGPRRSRDSR
jgi:AcrR family transcriptional regulator